jgi:diadenosine tetraphosphatase ApaH/serine/threonine PP2A family protein phosphatase
LPLADELLPCRLACRLHRLDVRGSYCLLALDPDNGRRQKNVWNPVSPLIAKSTLSNSQPSRAILFMCSVRDWGFCALWVQKYSISGMLQRVVPERADVPVQAVGSVRRSASHATSAMGLLARFASEGLARRKRTVESSDEIRRSAPRRVDLVDTGGAVLACLADVHGNTAALDAVLASDEFALAGAVAFLGCTTTGPDPHGVLERCADLKMPVFYLAGNGERWVLELASGVRPVEREVDEWLIGAHGDDGLATIGSWPGGLRVAHPPAGGLRLCHGSPRSDIELLTSLTGEDRLREATAGVEEAVVVHGHTHVQYRRDAVGKVITGAGSVGLPYAAGAGARWALISDQVRLVTTPYDLDRAAAMITATGYPADAYLKTLRQPPSPEEMNAKAEQLSFSN